MTRIYILKEDPRQYERHPEFGPMPPWANLYDPTAQRVGTHAASFTRDTVTGHWVCRVDTTATEEALKDLARLCAKGVCYEVPASAFQPYYGAN